MHGCAYDCWRSHQRLNENSSGDIAMIRINYHRKKTGSSVNSKQSYKNLEEIFIDSENISGFDVDQMQNVMKSKLPSVPRAIVFSIMILFLAGIGVKLYNLQIKGGEKYMTIAEKNRLTSTPLWGQRGTLLDRNGILLAWNSTVTGGEDFPRRTYIEKPGFSMLGYIEYPKKDKKGQLWQKELKGYEGLEKTYNELLRGENGSIYKEVDSSGKEIGTETVVPPKNGSNVITSIDANMQSALFNSLSTAMNDGGYQGAAGIIMDIKSGEVLAMVSAPEFSPQVFSDRTDVAAIREYFNDKRKPFLNRVTSGLYSPGSTIKPFIALAALNEGIVTEDTTVDSTGSIEIPTRYNPDKPSIYRDWQKGGHGITNVTKALAESVNTYFYAIGGGYKNIKGIGIKNIEKYTAGFGLASETGISFLDEKKGNLPTPSWKQKLFKENWWLGDTYITSIGQYGFQVTPIQLARGIGGIANGGHLVTPVILKGEQGAMTDVFEIDPHAYEVIRNGMRQTVLNGTAWVLNLSQVNIAAKTGTAQVGTDKTRINSWVTGFFPYENPRYSFAVVLESAPKTTTVTGSWAMRQFLKQSFIDSPDFWGLQKNDTTVGDLPSDAPGSGIELIEQPL